ncbi:hypothetical protein [Flavobacterium sp.]|uniref:hypothetical protein n=1 Tax=Flavobacterium sp. TaxID=239 RepID=UPI003D129CB8
MEKILITLILLTSSLGFGQDFFTYKISKPYCVLHFMETASPSSQGVSITYKEFIDQNGLNDAEFKMLCNEYKNLNFYYNIIKEDYPESRKFGMSTYDLLSKTAAESTTLEEMRVKCMGVLPLETIQQLYQQLKKAEIYYDKMVWNDIKEKAMIQLENLKKFETTNASFFLKINNFYNTPWTRDIPFQVVLSPLPGKNGHSTANPYINTLCVGNFVESTDLIGDNGVVLHEMCHILYKEQNKQTQFLIEEAFKSSKSMYAKYAYSFFDEALATAIGNGWTYKKLNGKLDDGEWYAQPTINSFAKAIYPLVESYIETNKKIDLDFIVKAIQIFEVTLPNAINEYSIALNSVQVFAPNFKEMEVVNELSEYFQIYSLELFTSFNNLKDKIQNSENTRLILLDSNHQKNLLEVKKYIPEIKTVIYNRKSEVIAFRDKKNRVVILMMLKNKSEFKPYLEKLAKQKYFVTTDLIQKL